MRIPLRAFMCIILTLFLLMGDHGADAKGISGSRFGGGTRSYKSGYYSRSYRYSTTYMYWGSSGYRGTRYRSGTYGSTNQAPKVDGVQAPPAAVMDKAFCKRDLRVDGPSNGDLPKWVMQNIFQLNSTMQCVQQLDEQPGSPRNTIITDLQLNRYQWAVTSKTAEKTAATYPAINFKYWPDYDVPDPTYELALQLTKINFRTSDPFQDSAGNIVATYDLSTLNFLTCTVQAGCSLERPYPAAERMDFAKQLIFNMTTDLPANQGRPSSQAASAPAAKLYIQFTTTDDFAEDSDIDHIFIRPSDMKVDFQLQMASKPNSSLYVDIEAVVFAPASGDGSRVYAGTVAPDRLAVEYDPKLMSRAIIGDPGQIAGGYVSWWSTTNNDVLCLEANTGPNSWCVTGGLTSTTPVCGAGSVGGSTSVCGQQNTTKFKGYGLRWSFQQNAQNWKNNQATWYLDFGYTDPSEITDVRSGASTVKAALVVLFVCLLSAVL